MKILGVDIGFGFTKATDGRQRHIFKSIIGEATEIQFREQLVPNSKTEDALNLHIVVDEKPFFIGELAERQSTVRAFTLDQNQLMARFAKALALTAVANLTDNDDPVRLVTGLPINAYRRHKDDLLELLQGEHPIVVKTDNGQSVERRIRIDKVRIVPQPFGSVFNLMLNDLGKVSDRNFAQEKIGVVDVGFRTADYSICDKTQYSERGSQTSDAGMSQAYKIIAQALQEKSGVNVELYRLYEAIAQNSIKIHGKNYGLRRITEQACGQLAARIASDINSLWADDWDIDRIVITGGGGAALQPYLQPLLEGEVLALDPSIDARFNNTLGYYKYGQHIWDRTPKPAEQ